MKRISLRYEEIMIKFRSMVTCIEGINTPQRPSKSIPINLKILRITTMASVELIVGNSKVIFKKKKL